MNMYMYMYTEESEMTCGIQPFLDIDQPNIETSPISSPSLSG